jgi:hypothetical protein
MGTPKRIRGDGLVRGRSQTPNGPITHGIITATIPEFRRISGIGRTRIYELLDAGEIESIHIGARRLILVESYRQLVERRRVKAQPLVSGQP